MAKKLSFDKLPDAVEKILEILNSDNSGHAALSEIAKRMTLLEKKIDHLEKSLHPEMATMSMHEVCRLLKARPKTVSELAATGLLPSHTEGRKTLFWEADVIRFYASQPAWKAALSAAAAQKAEAETGTGIADDSDVPGDVEPAAAQSKPAEESFEGRQRIDIHGVSKMLGRTTGAIRQHMLTGLPYHKEGRRVHYFTDEIREWELNHRRNKSKNHK